MYMTNPGRATVPNRTAAPPYMRSDRVINR